jgi:NTE family protein
MGSQVHRIDPLTREEEKMDDNNTKPRGPVWNSEEDSPAGAAAAAPPLGWGLCMSGGGYRAMLFHVGTLWRLNELGYLPKLDRISSVSGGSITAGVLGLAWKTLSFDANGVATNFNGALVNPVRQLAATSIDVKSVLWGIFGPGSVNDQVIKQYRKTLFGDKTLQDLPDRPRFVINATNVQSGALWRFSKPYMGDWKVGRVMNPQVTIAVAVAASSAFPPVLSPARLKLQSKDFAPGIDPLQKPPFTTDVVLSDGGVYDNMGLETIWKRCETVLVSDGGAPFVPDPDPKTDWARHAMRILDLIDNQVRSLRKREVVGAFKANLRQGSYWGIGGDIASYPATGTLPCPIVRTRELAAVATRLDSMDAVLQERLINWGYALCDAGFRSHVDTKAPAPAGFPYPASAV